jgi:hypothetical protein
MKGTRAAAFWSGRRSLTLVLLPFLLIQTGAAEEFNIPSTEPEKFRAVTTIVLARCHHPPLEEAKAGMIIPSAQFEAIEVIKGTDREGYNRWDAGG